MTVLLAVHPPPRLVAHLRAVHDVAVQLTDWLSARYPAVALDLVTVHLGAALHDVGKALHPDELLGPGSRHEPDGYGLLLSHAIGEPVAAIARDHADWRRPDISLESLIVSLADKIWKDQRVVDLEQCVVDRLAAMTGEEPWSVYADLDDVLAAIGAGAPSRLAFQTRYAAQPGSAIR